MIEVGHQLADLVFDEPTAVRAGRLAASWRPVPD